MARQPMGKTLLRNVIRHTDAHNKIQEEMEMWKMRDWEVQTSHHKHFPDSPFARGHMHCDRVSDHHTDLGQGRERMSEHDDREARYWTRKLYDFEANDPDRWGHSGFKELYPEEFESDGDKSRATKKSRHRKLKKSKSGTEACLSKQSKKASRKKKKKKKKKKGEEDKRQRAECWSSDSSSEDSGAVKDKQRRRRTKSRHKNKKTAKSRGRDEDSSSGDGAEEVDGRRQTCVRKKRKQDPHRDSDSGPNTKKKRKNWRAAGEESSDESSAD